MYSLPNHLHLHIVKMMVGQGRLSFWVDVFPERLLSRRGGQHHCHATLLGHGVALISVES